MSGVLLMETNMMLLFTLALVGCVRAAPVIEEQNRVLEPKVFQPSNTNTNDVKGVSHTNNPQNDNNMNVNLNVNQQRDSQSLVMHPLSMAQKGQGQMIGSSLPLLESLSPLGKEPRAGNIYPTDISKEFTKRVLQAFFEELKNRPDLVDEILKRETYKLLLSIAQEDTDYNPIPSEVDLTRELLAGPAMPIENPTPNNSEIKEEEEEQISKKSTQQNVKPEGLKTLSSNPGGHATSSDASKIQAALAKELDKLGQASKQTAETKTDDSSDESKPDNSVSQQRLTDPYYYYVYYDENEAAPNSGTTGTGKVEESPQSPVKDSGDKSVIKPNQKENNDSHPENGSSPTPEKNDDIVVNKIALAVRSIITRDMEKELARSRLAHMNELIGVNPNYSNYQMGPNTKVKVAPVAQAAQQTADDEESELANLSQ